MRIFCSRFRWFCETNIVGYFFLVHNIQIYITCSYFFLIYLFFLLSIFVLSLYFFFCYHGFGFCIFPKYSLQLDVFLQFFLFFFKFYYWIDTKMFLVDIKVFFNHFLRFRIGCWYIIWVASSNNIYGLA